MIYIIIILVNDMNRKGFTLVELLGALVILSLIVTIGGVVITKTITSSKEKNYQILVKNIKNAVEAYYQECNYGNYGDSGINSGITCSTSISLGDLLNYGYISPNGKDKVLVNPKTNEDISACTIGYSFDTDNNSFTIWSIAGDENCPQDLDYNG